MFKLMKQAVRAALPRWLLTGCALLELPVVTPNAQQITGTSGSPCATTIIGGHEIPPSPQKFEGKIERNAVHSTLYWPGRIIRPKSAPNVLLITTDDTNFGVSGTFRGAAILA
jgi:arylsulfatase